MTEVVQVTDRLADVPGDWDSLVGDDGFYLSRDWLRFVEPEPGTRARYLFLAESGTLRGALPIYRGEDAPNVRYQSAHFHEFLGVDGTFLLAGSSRGYRSTLLLPPADRVGALSRSGLLGELLRTATAIARADGYAGGYPAVPADAGAPGGSAYGSSAGCLRHRRNRDSRRRRRDRHLSPARREESTRQGPQ
jgi:hypothetical protein